MSQFDASNINKNTFPAGGFMSPPVNGAPDSRVGTPAINRFNQGVQNVAQKPDWLSDKNFKLKSGLGIWKINQEDQKLTFVKWLTEVSNFFLICVGGLRKLFCG